MLVVAALKIALLAQQTPWAEVESVFGRKGIEREGVYRLNFPRRDLNVQAQGIKLEPGFALNTWVAFAPMSEHRSRFHMAMGDMVVTAAELPIAQAKLLQSGFTITGVHNHIAGESPAVKYMHFSAKGELAKLAAAFKGVLQSTPTPLQAPPASTAEPPNWDDVEKALGRTGTKNGKVLAFSIPRKETIREQGEPLKSLNGGNSSLNFQWVDETRAAVTSDLVLLADEVDSVVSVLRDAGIPITALHNHMVYDEPRTFHLHVFAVGERSKLASAMAEAVARTNSG